MLRRLQELFSNIPDDNEEAAIEEVAQRVVREGMGPATIVFLESSKPMSFFAGQAAIFATPLIGGFIEPMRLERYADMFSRRDFLERLIRRIEELEDERIQKRKSAGGKSANDNDK